jgi:hypothetical protein
MDKAALVKTGRLFMKNKLSAAVFILYWNKYENFGIIDSGIKNEYFRRIS